MPPTPTKPTKASKADKTPKADKTDKTNKTDKTPKTDKPTKTPPAEPSAPYQGCPKTTTKTTKTTKTAKAATSAADPKTATAKYPKRAAKTYTLSDAERESAILYAHFNLMSTSSSEWNKVIAAAHAANTNDDCLFLDAMRAGWDIETTLYDIAKNFNALEKGPMNEFRTSLRRGTPVAIIELQDDCCVGFSFGNFHAYHDEGMTSAVVQFIHPKTHEPCIESYNITDIFPDVTDDDGKLAEIEPTSPLKRRIIHLKQLVDYFYVKSGLLENAKAALPEDVLASAEKTESWSFDMWYIHNPQERPKKHVPSSPRGMQELARVLTSLSKAARALKNLSEPTATGKGKVPAKKEPAPVVVKTEKTEAYAEEPEEEPEEAEEAEAAEEAEDGTQGEEEEAEEEEAEANEEEAEEGTQGEEEEAEEEAEEEEEEEAEEEAEEEEEEEEEKEDEDKEDEEKEEEDDGNEDANKDDKNNGGTTNKPNPKKRDNNDKDGNNQQGPQKKLKRSTATAPNPDQSLHEAKKQARLQWLAKHQEIITKAINTAISNTKTKTQTPHTAPESPTNIQSLPEYGPHLPVVTAIPIIATEDGTGDTTMAQDDTQPDTTMQTATVDGPIVEGTVVEPMVMQGTIVEA